MPKIPVAARPRARQSDVHLVTDEDSIYEQDIQRNPTSVGPWLEYADFKLRHGTIHEQAFVLERACVHLPRSYKLWKMVRRPPSTVLTGSSTQWPSLLTPAVPCLSSPPC